MDSKGMLSHKTSMQTMGIGYVTSAIIVLYLLPIFGITLIVDRAVELVGFLTYIFNVIMPEKLWKRDHDRNS